MPTFTTINLLPKAQGNEAPNVETAIIPLAAIVDRRVVPHFETYEDRANSSVAAGQAACIPFNYRLEFISGSSWSTVTIASNTIATPKGTEWVTSSPFAGEQGFAGSVDHYISLLGNPGSTYVFDGIVHLFSVGTSNTGTVQFNTANGDEFGIVREYTNTTSSTSWNYDFSVSGQRMQVATTAYLGLFPCLMTFKPGTTALSDTTPAHRIFVDTNVVGISGIRLGFEGEFFEIGS